MCLDAGSLLHGIISSGRNIFRLSSWEGETGSVIGFVPLVIVPKPALSVAEVSTSVTRGRPELWKENIRR